MWFRVQRSLPRKFAKDDIGNIDEGRENSTLMIMTEYSYNEFTKSDAYEGASYI